MNDIHIRILSNSLFTKMVEMAEKDVFVFELRDLWPRFLSPQIRRNHIPSFLLSSDGITAAPISWETKMDGAE